MLYSPDLRQRARDTLKGHYWTAFVASLVVSVVSGGGSGITGRISLGEEELTTMLHRPGFVAGLVVGLVAAMAAALALSVFVAGPLEVGNRRYFTSACCRQYDLGNLGFGFRHNYWNVVKTQLLRTVRLWLWTLLFIIPGIVKGLAYSMVPYILADNPHMAPKRAIELSCRMTNGHKAELFGLLLSFIGWLLLGALCCGVGTLFVAPYMDSAYAEAYMQLRHEALQRGDTTLEELFLSYQ